MLSFLFRKDYIDVIEYFIKTNQLTGDSLDDQNQLSNTFKIFLHKNIH
jgi:hypothetical protein